MLQDRLPVKFQDVDLKDMKFKHEIFVRIDVKHQTIHNFFAIIFCVAEITVCC